MSNCTALEIVDNEYRLITSDASYHNIEAFGLKSYWKDGEYIEEYIEGLKVVKVFCHEDAANSGFGNYSCFYKHYKKYYNTYKANGYSIS